MAGRDVTVGGCRLIEGDCLEVLAGMPDASVHAVVTDPPAGISFMNKAWDHHKGGRAQWCAWMEQVARECLRVIRPGGHALVWALPRTSHWTATAWEDAGWQVKDRLAHLFGGGFPKHRNALKPAVEDWWLFRRPLSEGSVAANVLRHGTGAIAIDACRVATNGEHLSLGSGRPGRNFDDDAYTWPGRVNPQHAAGRWPPNCLTDGSPEVLAAFEAFGERAAKRGSDSSATGKDSRRDGVCFGSRLTRIGAAHGDTGSAARFFPQLGYEPGELRFYYSGKATGAEREGNSHCCVKPLSLMGWLLKLVVPKDGVVLDCFAGSASTLVAASRHGLRAIGIEREADYVAIGLERLRNDAPLLTSAPPVDATAEPEPCHQATLFDEEAA